MCGDTGVPRWYVKIGNEARIEGGPIALEAALAPRHRARHPRRAAAPQPRASALAHRPQQQCRDRRARDRIRLPSRCRLDRAHHRAQGRPVRLRLPHAVSGRRHRGHQAVLSRHADRLRQARLACQPAIVGVGLGGSKDICMVLGKQASCLRIVGSRNPGSADRCPGRGVQGSRQQHRHGRHGFHRLLHGDRLPHRGRLLPHRRDAHVACTCSASRRGVPVRAFLPTAEPQFRTDPMWFTDYMRRSTVEWGEQAARGGGIDQWPSSRRSICSFRRAPRTCAGWRSARSSISLAASSPRARASTSAPSRTAPACRRTRTRSAASIFIARRLLPSMPTAATPSARSRRPHPFASPNGSTAGSSSPAATSSSAKAA